MILFFLGKLSQQKDQADNVKYVRNYEQYLELQRNAVAYKVKSLTPITHSLAEVVVSPLPEFSGFSRRTHTTTYAFLTSLARCYLFEKLQEIQKAGGKIFYCDTGENMIVNGLK